MAPASPGAVTLTLAFRAIPALVGAEGVLLFVNFARVCSFLLTVGKSFALVVPAVAITLALAVSEAHAITKEVFYLINVARFLLVSTVGVSIADILVAVSITLALGGRPAEAWTKIIPALIDIAELDLVRAVGGSPALILVADTVALALRAIPAQMGSELVLGLVDGTGVVHCVLLLLFLFFATFFLFFIFLGVDHIHLEGLLVHS